MNTDVKEFQKFMDITPKEIMDRIHFIPLPEGKKKPPAVLVDKTKGEKATDDKFRLSTEQAVDRIRSGKNVGIYAEPNGIMMFDMDADKGKIVIPNEVISTFDETLTVMTRNGGRQLYYLNNGKFKNKIHYYNGIQSGEIRADTYYGLAPGSYVAKDDDATPEATGVYTIVNDAPMVELNGIPNGITIKDDIPKKEIVIESQHTWKNDLGMPLYEIRRKNQKLDTLLKGANESDRSASDMAAVQVLYFYRFTDSEIAGILREYRPYEKTERQDYIDTTISKIIRGDRYSPEYKPLPTINKTDIPKEPIPEVNSIDDIPVPTEDIIDPISFNGLPDYNFIKMFVDYIASVSDTYPEYAFLNGISILSTTARRRLYFKLNGRFEYTNLITLCLGQSGYSRKGGAMMPAYSMLRNGIGDTFLSKDFSPEGLISEISDTITTVKRTKEGSEPVIDYQIHPIRKAVCALWKDEAGQFYAQLNKPHMQSTKELLCHLYDCPPEYGKTLSGKKFHVDEIYLSMNLATTPTSFIQNVTTKDVHTGFLARHNIVNPSYTKKRKGITEDSDEDLIHEKAFEILIKIIDKLLPERNIRVRIGNEELAILDNWCREREEYFARERNETMGSFFARFQMNVIKIATLIDLGNLPACLALYINEVDNSYSENKIIINHREIISKKGSLALHTPYYLNCIVSLLNNSNISDYNISSMCISIDSMIYAMKLYDSVFLPYAYQICLQGKVAIFTNYLSNIYNILQDKRKIDRANLMRLSNVSKRVDFDEAMETLKEAGAVIEYKVKGKTKPISAYVYVPSPYTKLFFTPINTTIKKDNSFIELTKKGYVSQQPGNDNTQKEDKYIPQSHLHATAVTEVREIPATPVTDTSITLSQQITVFGGLWIKDHGMINSGNLTEFCMEYCKHEGNGKNPSDIKTIATKIFKLTPPHYSKMCIDNKHTDCGGFSCDCDCHQSTVVR